MSLVTKTDRRVYQRKFDHDEARRLREEDPERWTYPALAKHFGVSTEGVRRVLHAPTRARHQARANEWARKTRQPCLGGCGRLVWSHMRGRTGYCLHCVGRLITSTDVRETELRCRKCGEWKPDEEFPQGRRKDGRPRNVTRRGRRTFCRSCSTVARREHRHRHPEIQRAADARRAQSRRETSNERNGVMAEYIVLQQSPEDENLFEVVSVCDAPSGDLAIERVLSENGSAGSYVAVLKTRFEVVSVAPQTSLRVQR